jgi:type II secretory pathway pseudopilin PulG
MNDAANPRCAGLRAQHRHHTSAAGERGLVLLTLLIALMLVSIALTGALDVWALQRRRQQEEQLLFVGNQYRQAIQRYYRAGRVYPMSVDDLLEDNRFQVPLHHLRRAYPDPITGKNDWLFLRQDDRFFGIYSSSNASPIKRANFPARYVDFETAKTYAEWQFFYLPPVLRNSINNNVPVVPARNAGLPALGNSPAALR